MIVEVALSLCLSLNNPGCILKTDVQWVGEVSCADPVHECFETPEHGVRAIAVLMDNYYRLGFREIEDVIERYGPKGKEYGRIRRNYRNYIKSVSYPWCGEDFKSNMVKVINGIIYFENGVNPYQRMVKDVVNGMEFSYDKWECSK